MLWFRGRILKLLKKHWLCCSLMVLPILLVFNILYVIIGLNLGFIDSPFMGFISPSKEYIRQHYRNQWELIDITKFNTKKFEYYSLSGEHPRCFMLAFEKLPLYSRGEDFYGHYQGDYSTLEKLQIGIKDKRKPHLVVRIYKQGKQLDEQDVYILKSDSYTDITVNNEDIDVNVVGGGGACYRFEDNTTYTIEVINNRPLPDYQGIRTFFGIDSPKIKF